MSEIEELRKEVDAMRAEVTEWKAIAISQLSTASRARGFAEGVAEIVKLRLDWLEQRVLALELKQFPQATHIQDLTKTEFPGGWNRVVTFTTTGF